MSEKTTAPRIPIYLSMDAPEPLYAQIEFHPLRRATSGHKAPLDGGTRGPDHVQHPHRQTRLRRPRARGAHTHQAENMLRRRGDHAGGDQGHRREPAAAAFREGILAGRRAGPTKEELRDTIEGAAIGEDQSPQRRTGMTGPPVISLEDVRKSYEGGFELGPLSLEVEPGHIVAADLGSTRASVHVRPRLRCRSARRSSRAPWHGH